MMCGGVIGSPDLVSAGGWPDVVVRLGHLRPLVQDMPQS